MQDVFTSINPSTTSGSQLATLLNNFRDAMMSGLSGASEPSGIGGGGMWVDTSQEGSPNFKWSLKMYDGTVSRTLLQLNLATGSVILSGSEDTFQVSHTSDDAVGSLLKLYKARIATTNGRTNSGDTLGELQFIGRTDTPTTPVTAKIIAVTSDDFSSSAQGTYLAFYATTDSTATLAEAMRLQDGKLGVGTTSPSNVIHAKGSTGIRSEYQADSANGAILQFKKKRSTGVGASQSSDILSQTTTYTTDDAGAEAASAQIRVTAAENHTSTNLGTIIGIYIAKVASSTLTEVLRFGDIITANVQLFVKMLALDQQNVATASTIAQLDATKAVVRFTGSTATSLQGINSGTGLTKVITLHNASTATVTVKHADSGASASDRFSLPNSRDILIAAGSSGEFFYDSVDSRWKVKSGSGSGSGGGWTVTSGTRGSPTNVSAGTAPTITTVDAQQIIYVQGNSTHVEMTANPQIGSPGTDGYVLRIRGRNSDQTLTFVDGNGLVLKAEKRTLGADSQLELQWDGTYWVETGFSE